MKKIGLITYHQAVNYGAVLQCYALQETLIKLGYDVKVIDYNPAFRGGFSNTFAYRGLLRALISLRRIVTHPSAAKKARLFREFCKVHLVCTEPYRKGKVSQDFDVYLLGSDQLWRTNMSGVYIDTVYFGEFDHPAKSKVCGYAISGDAKSVKGINSNKLLQYTNNFDTLSFREESLGALVHEITGAKYRVDIDPTLLADPSIYNKLIDSRWSNERYVLYYNLRGDNIKLRDKANNIAKVLDCKVIDIMEKDYSPYDFVSLFKYAQYVVTSSFHGTAFSLIFEKPLCCLVLNDGHDKRYVDLLNSIGAEKMLADINEDVFVQKFNYAGISNNVSKLRERSLTYLKGL